MNDYDLDRFGRMQPAWRVPVFLLAMLLGLMALISFPTPGEAADNDTSVALSLTILSRACEIEGGHLAYTIHLNEDGSIENITASCSAAGSFICTIWGDGDYVCALRQPEQTLQQQVSVPGSSNVEATMTEGSASGVPTQSTAGSGTKVESRPDVAAESTPTPVQDRERG